MDIEKLDKYLMQKSGVTVRNFDNAKRYLLCDKMFARLSFTKDLQAVLSVKAKPGRLEYFRGEYPNLIVPCDEIEPLHWNSVLLGGAIADEVVFAVADESYEVIYADLSYHTKKFMDVNEPSYKYVLDNIDVKKFIQRKYK